MAIVLHCPTTARHFNISPISVPHFAKSLSAFRPVLSLAVFFYYFAALLAKGAQSYSQSHSHVCPGQRSIKITHSQTNKMLTAYISVSVPATVFS